MEGRYLLFSSSPPFDRVIMFMVIEFTADAKRSIAVVHVSWFDGKMVKNKK